MDDMKDLLFKLCSAVGVPGVTDASEAAVTELKKYATVYTDSMGSVFGVIKGESDYTVLLDAHIDEIGMVVTAVLENGFLKVAKVGGVDIRVLPDSMVTIHGKRKVKGIFCSTPPHLSKDDSDKFNDLDNLYLDTGLSNAKDVIAVGDRISFYSDPVALLNGQITTKSLDDRAGCAALIHAAKLIEERGTPPCTVVIALTAQEELGNRGAKTAAYDVTPNEAIAVDVSFGYASGLPEEKCGKLGEGPMLGVSPVLSRSVTNKLIYTADKYGIPLQFEGMGGNTSTNADVIGISREGVKCGLLSVPQKNMHTAVEIVTVSDVIAVAELITQYIFEGGVMHD